MSAGYDLYLRKHLANVKKGLEFIVNNLPQLLCYDFDYEWQIGFDHDTSKNNEEEYAAYDAYFYGGNKSYAITAAYNKAWLAHIHNNPHHWQHWVLINDDPREGELLIEMPHNYIVEMICDWWSFSWARGDLSLIFSWYDEHKEYIKFHRNTRKIVEHVLDSIKKALEGNK